MIFRLSQKLCSKIGAGKLSEIPLGDNPFADWSANLFVADRTQYILLSNTKSLYTTVLFRKGITDDRDFIELALGSIRKVMELDGQELVYRRFIGPASGTVRFAKALDRSVTGSMNELIHAAKIMLAGGEMSPLDASFHLNDVLLSVIAPNRAAKYGRPREAFKSILHEQTTTQGGEA
jgi:hypothetical protein